MRTWSLVALAERECTASSAHIYWFHTIVAPLSKTFAERFAHLVIFVAGNIRITYG